jgi:phosphonopyruvate decarboxylase
MINAAEVVGCLSDRGFGPYLGVPCTTLRPLLAGVLSSADVFIATPNEGDAIGIAAGAYLTGRRPVVLSQNSGIGNMMGALTSLMYTFRLPVLLIVSWRGKPGHPDEPQHELMGQITCHSLDLLGVRHRPFPSTLDELRDGVEASVQYMKSYSLPFAFVLGPGVMSFQGEERISIRGSRPLGSMQRLCAEAARMKRIRAIETVMAHVGCNDLVVSTTGLTSRELYDSFDRPGNFYVLGSMGSASMIGLGIALHYARGKVIVLDGDGAALMRLQTLASIGHYHPPDLIHVVLDNARYDSTGGQPTISPSVHFAEVAQACSYASSVTLARQEDLDTALCRCMNNPGPHFIHIKLLEGTAGKVGRSTLTPIAIRDRFMECVRRRMDESFENV